MVGDYQNGRKLSIWPDPLDGLLERRLEPPLGFEPRTFTLQKCCSTAGAKAADLIRPTSLDYVELC